MARFLVLASWFHLCLAMVLATVGLLIVPENAFADAGCVSSCASTYGTGTYSYYVCLGNCCVSDCSGNGDPGCGLACCSQWCYGDPNCMTGCQNAFNSQTCIPSDCNTLKCLNALDDCSGGYCRQDVDPTNCGACICRGVSSCSCKS